MMNKIGRTAGVSVGHAAYSVRENTGPGVGHFPTRPGADASPGTVGPGLRRSAPGRKNG
jgi:hypothetical protein